MFWLNNSIEISVLKHRKIVSMSVTMEMFEKLTNRVDNLVKAFKVSYGKQRDLNEKINGCEDKTSF